MRSVWDKPAHGPSLVNGRRDKKRYSVKRPIKRMARRKKREGIGNKCFLVSLALFVFGISVGGGACGRKGRESMSIVDGCKSCTAVTRWHCVRHVPSAEKTSLAVGRGVAEPSHRESGPWLGHNAPFLSASDMYIYIDIDIYLYMDGIN